MASALKDFNEDLKMMAESDKIVANEINRALNFNKKRVLKSKRNGRRLYE